LPRRARRPSPGLHTVPFRDSHLAARILPEQHEIVLPHFLDRAHRQVAEHERSVGDPDQARDLEPEMFKDPADLAVLTFGEAHLDPGVAPSAALKIGVDRAVADALDLDAVDKLLQLVLADLAEGAGAVGALDSGRRELELALQLAIRGEEEEPLGVEVEAADRDDPRQVLRQAVVNGWPAAEVPLCREETGGLVVAEQTRGGGRFHRLAIDGHSGKRGEQSRRLLDRLAVDGDPPFLDHPLDLAARRDACAGEQFGDALRLARVAGRWGQDFLRALAVAVQPA
jgi:hypothetical protein